MTRDTPSLLGGSELRDVSLAAQTVLPASVTISHPQLRDLVLPLRRGHILYPRGSAIWEQRWTSDDDLYILHEESKPARPPPKELFKLSFVPTCITTNGAIFACGGQKAELFMCDLPSEGLLRRAPPVKPFELNIRLPSGWINNAIGILPSWPSGWADRRAECQRAHAGYAQKRAQQDEEESDDDSGSSEEDSFVDVEDGDASDDYGIVDYDEVGSPAVATYPNSLPFGHTQRMQGNRRNGPQYVTSRRRSVHSTTSSTASRRERFDMPRILVSNNDKTVKMFSLRPATDLPMSGNDWDRLDQQAPLATSAIRQTQSSEPGGHLARFRSLERSVRPTFASSFRYDSLNESILAQNAESSRMTVTPAAELSLRGTRYLGESASAYRARNPAADAANEARIQRTTQMRQERAAELQRCEDLRHEGSEPRKLSLVGGTKFKVPVNHASLSPDLRTMVTVGDSTDVYLYEVIDGGRRFRKIGVYNAATDFSFSTSWSKDGRKFAVASQDGQVTVWDHRSSRPLALFYSSPTVQRDDGDESPVLHQQDEISSSSGRDAARVVKFSPEGSSRDLLVFSEEKNNIHIIDARTFNTHVVVPVPFSAPGQGEPIGSRRAGVDSVHWGISGVGFDPTGDWLYAGTERTVAEWDLRRYGGGEGGTWSMA